MNMQAHTSNIRDTCKLKFKIHANACIVRTGREFKLCTKGKAHKCTSLPLKRPVAWSLFFCFHIAFISVAHRVRVRKMRSDIICRTVARTHTDIELYIHSKDVAIQTNSRPDNSGTVNVSFSPIVVRLLCAARRARSVRRRYTPSRCH